MSTSEASRDYIEHLHDQIDELIAINEANTGRIKDFDTRVTASRVMGHDANHWYFVYCEEKAKCDVRLMDEVAKVRKLEKSLAACKARLKKANAKISREQADE